MEWLDRAKNVPEAPALALPLSTLSDFAQLKALNLSAIDQAIGGLYDRDDEGEGEGEGEGEQGNTMLT
jgi:hypothetical protein